MGRSAAGFLLLLPGLAACPSSLPWDFPDGASYAAIAIADANGDRLPDLWFCDRNGGRLCLALRHPAEARGFVDGGCVRTGDAPRALAVADLDRDGDVDAVVADELDGSVRWVTQTGPGRFEVGGTVLVGAQCRSVVVGDLNGDRWPDIAVGRSPGGVTLLFQGPASPGTFEPAGVLAGDRHVSAVAFGDVDGDGAGDLLAADMNGAQVLLFLQDPSEPGAFLPPIVLPTGEGPDGLVLRDLDGDGKPDLVVAAYSTDSVSVLLQDPAFPGTFLAAVDCPTGAYSAAVEVGDLDGDGRPDLALADSGGGVTTLSVLLQDPGAPGRFVPGPRIEAGPGVRALAAGDLDGDGLLDLAAARSLVLPDRIGRIVVAFQAPQAPGAFSQPVAVR